MSATPEEPAPPGGALRAAREARGFSLLKIAEELRLTPERVTDMEEGRYDGLGPAVFVRGHLRRYAALLGLPAQQFLEGYEATHHEEAVPEAPPPASLNAPVVESRNPLAAAVPVLLPAALAAIIAGAWWLQGRESPPAAAPVAAVTEAAVQPAAPPPPEAPVRADAGRLTVDFTDLCWIEVYDATGQRLAYELAEGGASLAFPGPAPWRVVLGNVGAARVTLDGRDVTLPGRVVVQNTATIYVDEAGTVARVPATPQDET